LCPRCLGVLLQHPQAQTTAAVLGMGTWFDIPVVLYAAGTNMAAAVTADQRVWVWGSPRGVILSYEIPKQLSAKNVPAGSKWANLWLGSDTLFLMTTNGDVFVWGSNVGAVTCMPALKNFDENSDPILIPWKPLGQLSERKLVTMAASSSSIGVAEGDSTRLNGTQEFAVFIDSTLSINQLAVIEL
jgi:alpha-tubulin suppressor-like RCC1 family protein